MDAFKNLGIDIHSLTLYLVNFGILMAVLTKFLYKPLMSFIDERRETVRKSIEEAEALKRAFQEQTAAREREQEKAVRTLRAELAEARAYADRRAADALADVERERERLLAETRGHVEEMKRDVIREAEKEVLARMRQVVLRVVREKVPDEVVRESVDDAWRSVGKEGEGV
jgi:F-type H+-transporting ATPase subunit b